MPQRLGYVMEYHDMEFFLPLNSLVEYRMTHWPKRAIRVTNIVSKEIVDIIELIEEWNKYDFSLSPIVAKNQSFVDKVGEAAIFFSEPRWIMAIHSKRP